MSEVAISVDDVSKLFRLYQERNQSLKAALMRGRRSKYEEFLGLFHEGRKLDGETRDTSWFPPSCERCCMKQTRVHIEY